MTIIKKTVLIFNIAFFIFFAAIYFISNTLILKDYENIEKEYNLNHIYQISNFLDSEFNHMLSTLKDWGEWVETYEFVKAKSQKYNDLYLKQNFPDDGTTLKNLNISTMLLINKNGELAQGQAFDLEKDKIIKIPKNLLNLVTGNSIFLKAAMQKKSIFGYVHLPEGVLMIASTTILNSKGKGSPEGVIIIGKFIDSFMLNKLSNVMQKEVILEFYNKDIPFEEYEYSKDKTILASIILNAKERYTNAILLHGFNDDPLFTLQFDTQRAFYNQAIETISIFLIIFIIFTFLIFSFIFWFLYRNVLSRLNNIAYKIKDIGEHKDLSIKLETNGNDEISLLSKSINWMLENIAELQTSLENEVQNEVDKRRENEKMLIQQSKMASMGEMLSAIAHQWRQPLNALGLTIQHMEIIYDDKEFSKEFLDETIKKSMKQINFMSKTIDDFKNFFKPNKRKRAFSIKESIEESITMVSAQLNSYSIKVNIEGDNIKINSHKNEFKQVVLNLINNAKDAILEKKVKGKIDIEIIQESHIIRVYFRDNAGGISEDVILRIFEPYFTTKEQGKGTGVGLYMSKAIIEDNMGGKMSVKNMKEGAEFKIEFNMDKLV